jgi:hypothetical protein
MKFTRWTKEGWSVFEKCPSAIDRIYAGGFCSYGDAGRTAAVNIYKHISKCVKSTAYVFIFCPK